jgi:hypothetical protein
VGALASGDGECLEPKFRSKASDAGKVVGWGDKIYHPLRARIFLSARVEGVEMTLGPQRLDRHAEREVKQHQAATRA